MPPNTDMPLASDQRQPPSILPIQGGARLLSWPQNSFVVAGVCRSALVKHSVRIARFVSARFKGIAIPMIAIATTGCSSITMNRTSDLDQIAQKSIDVVELYEPRKLIVIVSASIPANVVAALRRVRPAIKPDDVPEQHAFEIPPGYFLLESLEMEGSEAWFKGILGPQPKTSGPRDFQGCGAIYSIRLHKIDGIWTSVRKQDGKWIAEAEGPTVC